MTILLGLDVGDRRVGVAVSDAGGVSARPLSVFGRDTLAADAAVVARLAREQRAGGLVVGLPLMPDGSEAEQASRTRAWADEIGRRTGLGISWQDERLTTVRAEADQPRLRRHRASGIPTRAAVQTRRVRVDLGAAVRILQAALDRLPGGGSSGALPPHPIDDPEPGEKQAMGLGGTQLR